MLMLTFLLRKVNPTGNDCQWSWLLQDSNGWEGLWLLMQLF